MYKIPLNVLKLKANQIIYNDYNFKNNKLTIYINIQQVIYIIH